MDHRVLQPNVDLRFSANGASKAGGGVQGFKAWGLFSKKHGPPKKISSRKQPFSRVQGLACSKHRRRGTINPLRSSWSAAKGPSSLWTSSAAAGYSVPAIFAFVVAFRAWEPQLIKWCHLPHFRNGFGFDRSCWAPVFARALPLPTGYDGISVFRREARLWYGSPGSQL